MKQRKTQISTVFDCFPTQSGAARLFAEVRGRSTVGIRSELDLSETRPFRNKRTLVSTRPGYISCVPGLQLMVENALEQSQPDIYVSDASRHSVSASSSPFHNSPRGSRGGAAAATPDSKSPAPHSLYHQRRQTYDSGNGIEDSVSEVVRDAQRHIVNYFIQVRLLHVGFSSRVLSFLGLTSTFSPNVRVQFISTTMFKDAVPLRFRPFWDVPRPNMSCAAFWGTF